MSMNPRETTDKIRIDYQDYIASILDVRIQRLLNLLIRRLNRPNLLRVLILRLPFPLKRE